MSTLAINVLGCALIGVLMVLITDVWRRQRLVRPFLGTGVLGGFTTFSAFSLETYELLRDGQLMVALGYAFGSVAAGVLGVWCAMKVMGK